MWWVDHMRLHDYDPGPLDEPISEYMMFAQTHGGDPWCWHAGLGTENDEFEIHEIVNLVMFTPRAPTFEKFLFRSHLDELRICKNLESFHHIISRDMPLMTSLLTPEHLEIVMAIHKRIMAAFADAAPNPFRWDEKEAIIRTQVGARYTRHTSD